MIDKADISSSFKGRQPKKFKTKTPEEGKVSKYIPELKMTVLIDPGADIGGIIKRYRSRNK